MYDIDRDYNLWLQQQAYLLRKGNFVALAILKSNVAKTAIYTVNLRQKY